MYKAVRLRLYPTDEQEILLQKNCGCTRFIKNYFLAKRLEYYEKHGKGVSYNFMAEKLTA